MVRILLVVAAIATALASFGAGTAQAAEPSKATIVVLVDESGSLSAEDFAEEVRAVRTLAFVPNVDIYVLGFASEGSMDAVTPACGPDNDLGTCSAGLDRRTNAEGNDTDHGAALARAADLLDGLDSDAAQPKIVLMMTDGRFDPTGTGTPNEEDLTRLDAASARLRDLETQVWPLGFGNADGDALDDLAASAHQGACDGSEAPHSVLVDASDVAGEVNRIIGSATCLPDDFIVSPEATTMVLMYGEEELGEAGTVTVTNSDGLSIEFSCDFRPEESLWVCEIPTDELGPGKWEIDPPLVQFPVPFPVEPLPPTPPTSVPSTTVTPSTTSATPTTTAASALEEAPRGEPGFPWVLVAVGALGLLILLWVLLRDGSKLPRGVVAVRAAGQRDWTPEEPVRAEKRQAFEIDPDSGYPSIERTQANGADVVLEATRKGIIISGSMVEVPHSIQLGDEVGLMDDLTFTYVTDFEEDIGEDFDEDLEDTFI